MNLTKRISCLLATLLVAVSPAAANAQSREQFFFSDNAALSGGAVVSVTDDSGSTYYNPAGLALNRRSTADLSASTFGVRIRPVDGVMVAQFPNGPSRLKLDSFDILSAPHAVAFTRRLGENVSLGLALYVVEFDVRTGEDTKSGGLDPATGERVRQHVDLDLQSNKYVFGPAIGWQVTSGFRVGFGIYGTYSKRVASGRLIFDGQYPEEADGSVSVDFLVAHERGQASAFGIRAMAGLQWEPGEDWRIGLAARSPELQLTSSGQVLSLTAFADGGAAATSKPLFNETETKIESKVALSMPPQFIAGVARMFGSKSFVAVDVDLQPPLRVPAIAVDRDMTVNARVGGIGKVSERVSVGAGVFSDRATNRLLGSGIADDRIDWYGLSGGLQLRTLLPLADRNTGEPLVLATTIALRAAVGIGEARTYELDGGLIPRTADVRFYEFVPYLGSGLTF